MTGLSKRRSHSTQIGSLFCRNRLISKFSVVEYCSVFRCSSFSHFLSLPLHAVYSELRSDVPPSSPYRPWHIVDRPPVMSPRGLGLMVAIARQYNSRLFHGFLHRSRAKPIAYSFCYRQMTRIHPSKPSAFHVLLE